MNAITECASRLWSHWRSDRMPLDREAAFDRFCEERLSRLLIVFAVSTLICSLFWWPADYLVYDTLPQYVGPTRIWRLSSTSVSAIYLVARGFWELRRAQLMYFLVAFGVVCATMGYAAGLSGGPDGVQFHMLYILGFATVPVPMRLGTRVALTCAFCASVIAGCLVPFPEYRSAPHVPVAISLFVWVAGISVTFGHLSFLLLRSNFFQAALLADHNVRLEERVAERTRELRDLISRLETTREEERSRIARELHDQLGQELTAQRLTLAIAEDCLDEEPATARAKLAEMRRLLDGMMSTVRALIGDLRPWVLHDLGLGEAAQWLARRTEEVAGVRCILRLRGDPTSLDGEHSTTVFRVLQESLTNVTKHAHARTVSVDLETTDSAVELRVADDGIGPGERERAGAATGFGVLGMRERANALDGEFSIRGLPGGGTEVMCRLPRTPRHQEAARLAFEGPERSGAHP